MDNVQVFSTVLAETAKLDYFPFYLPWHKFPPPRPRISGWPALPPARGSACSSTSRCAARCASARSSWLPPRHSAPRRWTPRLLPDPTLPADTPSWSHSCTTSLHYPPPQMPKTCQFSHQGDGIDGSVIRS